jgi:hypothetical protein
MLNSGSRKKPDQQGEKLMSSKFMKVVVAVSLLGIGGWTQVYGVAIQDGGFDTTTTIGTGVPADQAWFIKDASVNDYATWAIVNGCAVATPGPVNSWGSANNVQALRQYNVAVAANTSYTLSFDYQAIGAGFAGDNVGEGTTDPSLSEMQMQVLLFNANGLTAVTGLGNIGAQTAGWTHASYSFLTGSDTTSVGFKFGALFAAESQGRDSFQLDNVSVPDGGLTVGLLGLGMAGLSLLRRRLS